MTTAKPDVGAHVIGAPASPAVASIMVHVDWNAGSDERIRLAANLSDRFGAVLIGVAGWVPGRERAALAHAELAQPGEALEVDQGGARPPGERFREVAGITARPTEWRGSFNFPREVIAREARAADLVVIGSRPAADDVLHTFDPGEVLLAAGRPVLIAPQGHAALSARRILLPGRTPAKRAARSKARCPSCSKPSTSRSSKSPKTCWKRKHRRHLRTSRPTLAATASRSASRPCSIPTGR